MTATLECDIDLVDRLRVAGCECERPGHHPNREPHCGQAPVFAARIRHQDACADTAVYWLCQDCLDEAVAWASGLIGYHCARCRKPVVAVEDLVGPVVPL